MGKNKVFLFVIFSVLALVGFFVLLSIAGRIKDAGIEGDNVEAPVSQVPQINESVSDPLITKSEDFYESLIRETDPIIGPSEAELKIIEFGDFQCQYCLAMKKVLEVVLPDYRERVAFVWKDFPNPIHIEAKTAAMAARCAQNQGKFWEYHDYLFETQADLSREIYNKIALGLNLDLSVFNKCLDGKETAHLIGGGLEDGQKVGVDATPYLIIGNGVYNYALSEEELQGIIESRLK